MIPLKRPPASLKLPEADRLTSTGAWRKWKSEAKATAAFREKFREWALANQDERCAFCRLPLGRESRRTNTIDHFAPKGAHAYWTYEALNLFAVCHSCNSEVKGELDPIDLPPVSPFAYDATSFTILHPYLDTDFTSHLIGGLDARGNEPCALQGLSPRGVETIRALGLDEQGVLRLWIQEWRAAQWEADKEQLSDSQKLDFEIARKELSGRPD